MRRLSRTSSRARVSSWICPGSTNHPTSSGSSTSSVDRSSRYGSTSPASVFGSTAAGPEAGAVKKRRQRENSGGGSVPIRAWRASASLTSAQARAGSVSTHGSFWCSRSWRSSASRRFRVIAPTAAPRSRPAQADRWRAWPPFGWPWCAPDRPWRGGAAPPRRRGASREPGARRRAPQPCTRRDPAALPPPARLRGTGGTRLRRPARRERSFGLERLEERIVRPAARRPPLGPEVYLARVAEGARVLFEAVGEPPEERPVRAAAGPRRFRDEPVGAAPLVLVIAGHRQPLDVLAEHPRHEQRVIADVASQRLFRFRMEIPRVPLPDVMDRQQGVHHGVEPASRQVSDRIEGFGAGEAGQEVRQVAHHRGIIERKVTEALPGDSFEEAGKRARLHDPTVPNFWRPGRVAVLVFFP